MNLKNVKHINLLKSLGLKLNKTLIVGSGTLALLGLRDNDDIDLWVTKDVYNSMKNNKKLHPEKQHGRVFYVSKDKSIEASDSMPCTKGRVEDYLKRAIVIQGFHFKSIDDVIAWKKCMGRPKDLEHIKLLEKYKKSHVTEMYLEKIQYTPGDLVDNHLAISAVIKKGEKILMMDHVKYNFWTIPIGKVDEGQSIEEGLKIELKEELNIIPTKFRQITGFKKSYMKQGTKIHVENITFLIEKWTGLLKNNEPHKHRSIKFMTIDEIKKLKKVSDATKAMLKVTRKI